jgi:hypothetical protein
MPANHTAQGLACAASALFPLCMLCLASHRILAISPVPQPAIPPDVRLTVHLRVQGNGVDLDEVFAVYRAYEQIATRALLTCTPTMKKYESWRDDGFEPHSRDMVCGDSHALIDASWGNVAPEEITIDVRMIETEKSRIDQLVAELEETLKAEPSVMTVMQDTWLPEHHWSQIK